MTDSESIFLQKLSPKARDQIRLTLKSYRESPSKKVEENESMDNFFDEVFSHEIKNPPAVRGHQKELLRLRPGL